MGKSKKAIKILKRFYLDYPTSKEEEKFNRSIMRTSAKKTVRITLNLLKEAQMRVKELENKNER